MEAFQSRGGAGDFNNDDAKKEQEMQKLANQSLGNDLWVLASYKAQELNSKFPLNDENTIRSVVSREEPCLCGRETFRKVIPYFKVSR